MQWISFLIFLLDTKRVKGTWNLPAVINCRGVLFQNSSGILSVHISILVNTFSMSPEMVSVLLVAYQKTFPSFIKVAVPIESAVKWVDQSGQVLSAGTDWQSRALRWWGLTSLIAENYLLLAFLSFFSFLLLIWNSPVRDDPTNTVSNGENISDK